MKPSPGNCGSLALTHAGQVTFRSIPMNYKAWICVRIQAFPPNSIHNMCQGDRTLRRTCNTSNIALSRTKSKFLLKDNNLIPSFGGCGGQRLGLSPVLSAADAHSNLSRNHRFYQARFLLDVSYSPADICLEFSCDIKAIL